MGQKKGYHPKSEFKKGNKIGELNKGQKAWNKNVPWPEEIKKKIRTSTFEYIKKKRDILWPCIGHNEKEILDKLEQEIGFKIIRQYECEGYFIDGYIPEINIAIEVDERPKNKPKDIEREKEIKQKLNCKFLRIRDYE